MAKTCSSLQKSLGWCQGTPELPGVRRRIYYTSKSDVVTWPTLARDDNGRITSAAYTGSFVLKADAKWKYIDILPEKSQLTSEALSLQSVGGEAAKLQTKLKNITL